MSLRACVLGVVLGAVSVSGSAMAAPPPSGPQESLVELIPARAVAAAVVRKHAIAPFRDLMFADLDMMSELRPYLERTLGVDLTRIEGMAFFALALDASDPKAAFILRIPNAGTQPLKLPTAGDAGGAPLYRLAKGQVCARLKAGLVVGPDPEVRAALAVDRGKEPAMTHDSALGHLLSTDANDVDLALAVGDKALPPGKSMGMRDALLLLRHAGLLELAVHGDAQSLNMAKSVLQLGMQSALQTLQQNKEKETAAGDPVKGATAIYTYYQMRKLVAELDPKIEGDALKVRYKLPDAQPAGSPVMLAAIVGIGAAIAIPSFSKYRARAKLGGVRLNVQRITTAVAAWDGKKLASLRSTDFTPAGSCCGQADDQCAPNPAAFSGPTWKALGITIDEASAFHYRVLVEAKQKRVTVEAQGDPDCDGLLTTVRSQIGFAAGPAVVGEIIVEGDQE